MYQLLLRFRWLPVLATFRMLWINNHQGNAQTHTHTHTKLYWFICHALYTVTALYAVTIPYSMTFRLFRAPYLEGASSCCFDLYACRTFLKPIETAKKLSGEKSSVSTDHILEKKYATQFTVTSFRIWSWKPQRTSRCSYPKRDAKGKTCCAPTCARQNVVVVGQ